MSKRYKSPRGRISNRSPLPRFIGLIPTKKSLSGSLAFSSITELYSAIFLIYSRFVEAIEYEAEEISFAATEKLAAITGWPDFTTTLDGGELELVNAKYSRDSLRDEERDTLDLFDAHCKADDRRHRVLYRDELEKNGFIATIMLLRPYGLLTYPPAHCERAISILGSLPPTHLEGWQERARETLIPLDLIYHLIYQQRLAIKFRPLLSSSLRLSRE